MNIFPSRTYFRVFQCFPWLKYKAGQAIPGVGQADAPGGRNHKQPNTIQSGVGPPQSKDCCAIINSPIQSKAA